MAVADPVQVASALARRVPELASLTPEGCEVRRVQLRKKAVEAFYRVEMVVGDGRPARKVDLRAQLVPPGWAKPDPSSDGAPLGSTGWRCWVPELGLDFATAPPGDPALPALSSFSDPKKARAVLERAIRTGSPRYADLRIEACSPRVARYTPGSRCAIVYELRFPAGSSSDGWPKRVVAKVHRGNKGRDAYESMRALWKSDIRKSRDVLIAEPLAYLPDLKVLVQAGIHNNGTLQELVKSSLAARSPEAIEHVSAYIDKTAAALGELHTCEVEPRRVITFEDEVAEIRVLLALLAAVAPTLAGAATPLLESLETFARRHPADTLRPAHGSFRPAQVLLSGAGIALIDFDGFCLAEPAMDVARFRAILKDVGLKTLRGKEGTIANDRVRPEHLAQIDELCERFSARYEAATAISHSRVALWEALDLLTLVLHSWTKLKLDRLGPRLALLRRHLRSHGLDG